MKVLEHPIKGLGVYVCMFKLNISNHAEKAREKYYGECLLITFYICYLRKSTSADGVYKVGYSIHDMYSLSGMI